MYIKVNDKILNIKDDIWEKHKLMHPIRTVEALKNNIRVVFYNKDCNNADIEKMILDEYNMQSNMPKLIKEARKIYQSEKE